MTFDGRMSRGRAHELHVAALIRAAGWEVCDFGQGQLSERMRAALKAVKTPLRWMPDLLCLSLRPDPTDRLLLVDAKSGRLDTPNYDLEKESHSVHHRWWVTFGIPVVYVFADDRCAYLTDLVGESMHSGHWNGTGSGTPYWLIPKTLARPFSSVFGEPVQEISA